MSQVIGDLTKRSISCMKAKLCFAFLCLPEECFHSCFSIGFHFKTMLDIFLEPSMLFIIMAVLKLSKVLHTYEGYFIKQK